MTRRREAEDGARGRCPRTDGSPERLVRADRRPLERLLPARGLRLRRRHAAAVPAAQRGRARPDVPDDRAGLGRQRGLARHGRRRDVRGVPGLVRDDVLGLLPRAAARPLLPDHPRGLVRVALEGRVAALAHDLALGERGRQLRRVADLGRRPRQPALRRADQLERRLRRQLLGPVQRLHRARRRDDRAAVRLPRRDVPDDPHGRRPLRAGGRDGAAALGRGRRRSARSSSPGPSTWPPTRTTRTSSRRSCRRSSASPRSCSRVVFVYRRRSGSAFAATAARPCLGGDDLHEPLPARDGVEHRVLEQPHRRRRGVGPLHARGDERRRADLPAADPALPGLDVPRVPRTRGRRRARSRRAAEPAPPEAPPTVA